ncbi:MAG: glycosyltransferase [bacterium]|nr:glycosyltransferase [bacterium]
MSTPKVTVIIPAYNAANYIANAVYSVLEQEGIRPEELELIVVNDASTDTTDAVMKRFQSDEQVIYLKNENNLGVAESRNLAIDMARGTYLAFLDADDWWEPDKLAAQLTALEQTDAPLCCSARALHEPDGTPVGRVIGVPERITYEMLLRTNSIPCGSVVMRSELAKQYHMTHAELHEDYILWLQILKNHGAAIGINEPYLHCRLSAGGKSRNKLKSARMQYGVYRYMGFGTIRSLFYFANYAVNGVKKYHGKN